MSSLPWHEQLLSQISDSLAAQLMPHAVALSGASGWGLVQLAEDICRLFLDLDDNMPVWQVAHPDLKWIEPDGAMIKIEQVRQVNEFAVQTAQIAPQKIVVLVAAELMNVAAANALLKTLEEPPANTYLILCTENWGKLLPTIRSRCARYQVASEQALGLAWLAEQGVSLTEQEFAAHGYAPLAVLQADNELAEFLDWLKQPVAKPPIGEDPELCLAHWYRQIRQRISSDPAGLQAQRLHKFADELLQVRRQLTTTNSANSQLLFERLAYLWIRLNRAEKV